MKKRELDRKQLDPWGKESFYRRCHPLPSTGCRLIPFLFLSPLLVVHSVSSGGERGAKGDGCRQTTEAGRRERCKVRPGTLSQEIDYQLFPSCLSWSPYCCRLPRSVLRLLSPITRLSSSLFLSLRRARATPSEARIRGEGRKERGARVAVTLRRGTTDGPRQ